MIYDNYYEYCKSDIDEVIDVTVEKIKDIIKDRAKDELESLKRALNNEMSRHIATKDSLDYNVNERLKVEKELAELKESIDKSEEVGFKDVYPLDTCVYYVSINYQRKEEVTCPTCSGTRYLKKEIDGVLYRAECPECKWGSSHEPSVTVYKYEVSQYYVSGYTVEINHNNERKITYKINRNKRKDHFFSKENNYTASSERVFLNKEEAKKYANELFEKDSMTAKIKTGNIVESRGE